MATLILTTTAAGFSEVVIVAGSIAACSVADSAVDSAAMPSVVAADFMAESVDADSSYRSLFGERDLQSFCLEIPWAYR
jgi:hypothetical protein